VLSDIEKNGKNYTLKCFDTTRKIRCPEGDIEARQTNSDEVEITILKPHKRTPISH